MAGGWSPRRVRSELRAVARAGTLLRTARSLWDHNLRVMVQDEENPGSGLSAAKAARLPRIHVRTPPECRAVTVSVALQFSEKSMQECAICFDAFVTGAVLVVHVLVYWCDRYCVTGAAALQTWLPQRVRAPMAA